MTEISLSWEMFDLVDKICERTFNKSAWKILGMHGLTLFEILFLARLRGTVTDDELAEIKALQEKEAAA